ncbi:MAG TPA: hypothetical protein VG753_00360 [Candidatus Paceibacterota bacterium]|nr:hypothetical protein [Candidatus Paceibacterota bacterium]
MLHPKTQLVFTRDYRIFGQFSNFPDEPAEAARPKHVEVSALPEELKIIVLSEETGTEYTRTDEVGYDMAMVSAKQLKDLDMPGDATPNNKAIKAFIDQLADDTPVILGWE